MLAHKIILITGANRGIGLGLVKQSLAAGAQVIAGCRNPTAATALHTLQHDYSNTLVITQLDVTSDTDITTAYDTTTSNYPRLDAIINNVGVYSTPTLMKETRDNINSVINVNATSAIMVTQTFAPLLKPTPGTRPTVLNITSGVGSFKGATHPFAGAYRLSKTAMNMATRLLSFELGPKGVTLVAVNPGWVDTDMGSAVSKAPLSVEKSSEGILEILKKCLEDVHDTNKWNGNYFHYNGEPREF
jgi:NAD(P)-dependent dehydrogenase (short-subunit alcohol dehydrogenase family)